MKDPYKVLGLGKDASEGDIKKQYRKLALQYHPDKNPDDPSAEAQFKEVSAAYEVLSDPEKRKMYDTYGDVNPRAQGPGPSGFDPFGGRGGFDFGDFFGNRRRRTRGDDVKKGIVLDFMEAVHGCTKKLGIDYPYACSPCKGNGSKDGTNLKECETCGGMGKVGYNQGFMQILQTCPSCQGRGKDIIEKCPECNGRGQKTKTDTVKVTIPPGIDHSSVLRLGGKGMPSAYGDAPGDLYLEVHVKPHSKFRREGFNILSEETISYLDAILGTKLIISTIHNKVDLKIPAGTQPGTTLKVAGKGVIREARKGDHLVKVNVSLPKNVSPEEQELLEKLKGLKK